MTMACPAWCLSAKMFVPQHSRYLSVVIVLLSLIEEIAGAGDPLDCQKRVIDLGMETYFHPLNLNLNLNLIRKTVLGELFRRPKRIATCQSRSLTRGMAVPRRLYAERQFLRLSGEQLLLGRSELGRQALHNRARQLFHTAAER